MKEKSLVRTQTMMDCQTMVVSIKLFTTVQLSQSPRDVTRVAVHTPTPSLDSGMQKQQLKATMDSKSCLMGSNQQKAIIMFGTRILQVSSLRDLDGKQLNKQPKLAGKNSLALISTRMELQEYQL